MAHNNVATAAAAGTRSPAGMAKAIAATAHATNASTPPRHGAAIDPRPAIEGDASSRSRARQHADPAKPEAGPMPNPVQR